MAAIDLAAIVSEILAPTGPYPLTSGDYTAGADTETVSGVFVERGLVEDPESGLDAESALLVIEIAEFATITIWAPGDTFIRTTEASRWRVQAARQRQAHLAIDFLRRDQRAVVAGP